MTQIKRIDTPLAGACVIQMTRHEDERGFFMETYNRRDLEEAGISADFVQDNVSRSVKGTVRGLHYQKMFPQDKIVRVCLGEIYEVIVDIREESPTYGKWFSTVLTDASNEQLFVPGGFAHGFLVLSDEAEISYKTTDFYHPEDEYGIIWNDPGLGIDWPVTKTDGQWTLEDGTPLIISAKDEEWPVLMAGKDGLDK